MSKRRRAGCQAHRWRRRALWATIRSGRPPALPASNARRPLLLLLCLTIGCSTFAIGAFPATLPEIGRSAALADWQLGIVAGVFGFARMVSNIPIGLFLTHHLPRALVLGPAVYAVGVLCLSIGSPFGVLVLGRALMGVGHAIGMVAGLTAILRFFAGPRLGTALNAFEFSAMLGITGGTVVFGLLPTTMPWNWAYLLTCAPQLLSLAVAPRLRAALPPDDAAGPRPLFARQVTGAGPARVTPLAALAFVAGSAIAITYATVEQFLIPLRSSREFGLARSGIAQLLVVMQITDIVALLPLGRLADRRGAAGVVGAVLLLLAVGVSFIAFGGLALVVAGTALFGLGMAGWMLPLSVLRSETPADRIGWRAALYRVCVDGGMFLGPFLSGVLAGRLAWLLPAAAALALAVTAGLLLVRTSAGGLRRGEFK